MSTRDSRSAVTRNSFPTFSTLRIFAVVAALGVGVLNAAECPTDTVAEYVANFGFGKATCTITGTTPTGGTGQLTISSFTFVDVGIGLSADELLVTPLRDVNGLGFQITPLVSWKPADNYRLVDEVQYIATVSSTAPDWPGIDRLYTEINGTATPPGFDQVVQAYCPGGYTLPPDQLCPATNGQVQTLYAGPVQPGLGSSVAFKGALYGPGPSGTCTGAFNTASCVYRAIAVNNGMDANGTLGGSAIIARVVNQFGPPISLSPPSPGSGTLLTTSVGPNFVTVGGFPHQPPNMGDEVNEPQPPVPTGPFVPGIPTPDGTSVTPLSLGGTPQGVQPEGVVRPLATVTFNANNSVGFTSAGIGCTPGVSPATCGEPSGASSAGLLFVTANWLAGYSTNGGSSFTQIDPTTIFPNDAVGFCCDQIVQYVPSIDRFIWLLQGTGYRLASASPAQIINNGGNAWTYWNLAPSVFGPSGSGFDYPDMSVGDNFLYISWDSKCSPNCNGGLQVARVPLSEIQASTTIHIGYTHQSDSNLAWGSHLTQNTGNEIFWAGHNMNNKLRVFSLAEGSNTYFWRDIGISSWANNTQTSTTPDNKDWLKFGFPGTAVIGATRSGNQLWFGWTAGTDSNFKQDHIELVTLDRNNNFSKSQQVQIWNSSFAFAYPALSSNACTGEIGLSLAFGGNGRYENHAVGFWGDFLVYSSTNSDSGVNRYGDYTTIRQAPGLNGAFFNAFGYGVNKVSPPGTGTQSDVRSALFGRGGACTLQ